MKIGKLSVAVVLLVTLALLASCGGGAAPPAEKEVKPPAEKEVAPPVQKEVKPIEVVFSYHMGVNDPQCNAYVKPMCQEIEERSGGRVKFTYYWSEALSKRKDNFYAIRDGIADFCPEWASVYIPGKFPLTGLGSLPYAAEDPSNVAKAMTKLVQAGWFDKEWEEVVLLGLTSTTNYHFCFKGKTHPNSLAEFKGLKVRTAGGYQTDFFKAMGIVPTVVDIDIYLAYQTGVIDSYSHIWTLLDTQKLGDITTSVLEVGYQCFCVQAFMMNKNKWNELPPDIQQIFKECTAKWGPKEVDFFKVEDALVRQRWIDAGIDVYSLPPAETAKLKALAKPVWQKYIDDMEAKGLPGQKLVDEYVKILKGLGETPPYP